MTPAPSIQALLNFPERFEVAASAVIAAALSQSVAKSGDAAPLGPEHASVEFRLGRALDTVSDANEYCIYQGCMLSVELSVPRDNDDPTPEQLASFAGRLSVGAAAVRAAMRQSQYPLNPDNLLYYFVTRLQPAGEQRGMTETQNADVITMQWEVDFTIIPGAWPSTG